MVARTTQTLVEHQQLVLAAPAEALHFTLEVDGAPDADGLRAAIGAAFPGVAFELTQLAPHHGEPLDRFFGLVMPGLPFAEGDLNGFDVGYDLKDQLGLASVEVHAPFEPPVESGLDDPSAGSSGGGGDKDKPSDRSWSLTQMRIGDAWLFSEGQGRPSRGRDVVIAQPDTGLAYHVMTRGRARPAWNFFNNTPDPTDPLGYPGNPGHGTSVATVAVGSEDGRLRMTGVAPQAFVRPFRAVQTVLVQFNNSEAIGKSILMGVEMGSQVVSMSLGGLYPRSSPPEFLQRAIRHAVSQGAVVVAAAGNIVTRLQPDWVTYPGWDPDVICAGGSTPARTYYEWACRGPEVTVSAPGRYVWTAWRRDSSHPVDAVDAGTGTSYATANIAGLAALWIAHHGWDAIRRAVGAGRVNALFRHVVRATAHVPSGWDTRNHGAGIADALPLLQAPLSLPASAETLDAAEATPRERLVTHLRLRGVGETALAAIDDAFAERYGAELDWLCALREAPTARASAGEPPVSGALAAAFPAVRELGGAMEPAE